MFTDPNYFTSVFQEVLRNVLNRLPSILGIIALLLSGLLIAWIVKWLLSILLRKSGIDILSERSGSAQVLKNWGIRKPVSKLIGKLGFWTILFLFLLVAIESLGLNIVAGIFKTIISYFPSLIGAVLILLIGGFIANLIGDLIGSIAEKSGMVKKSFLGNVIKYLLILFTAIIALQMLGVETILLSGVIMIALGGLSLALALAFGYGSRELAKNIVAGFHARETYTPGMRIKVGNHEGVLVRIGTYKFILENNSIKISLPNCQLTDQEVFIFHSTGNPS